jgi:SAM-dependent methyltransferase
MLIHEQLSCEVWSIDPTAGGEGKAQMTTTTADPHVALLELMNGYWITQSIAVAADLGLADALADGPREIADVAAEVGADERSLVRRARALAMVGVLDQRSDGRYGLTPLGECLRDGDPGSLRALARMRGSDWQWRAWRGLGHSVRTGETAFEHVYGKNMFEHLVHDAPEDGAVFDRAMTGHAGQTHAAIVPAYDFSRHRLVVDVGAGHGSLLTRVLESAPGTRGIAFDLPPVAEATARGLAAAGLDGRAEARGGDFFESVPAGGDAYLLSHIVHDWDDERGVTLLRNCRDAIAPDGRLLVCEMLVPDGPEPHFSKLLDIEMLVNTGGLERTLGEYRALFAAAGFELTEVLRTASPVSLIVGVPSSGR